MYKLIVAPQAKKELKVIKILYRQAVEIALLELSEDPFIGKPLTRELTEKYSYKISTYRIIYKINTKDKIVKILSAGHRSQIYQ